MFLNTNYSKHLKYPKQSRKIKIKINLSIHLINLTKLIDYKKWAFYDLKQKLKFLIYLLNNNNQLIILNGYKFI